MRYTKAAKGKESGERDEDWLGPAAATKSPDRVKLPEKYRHEADAKQ